jgi:hypothetical protein
MLDSLLHCGQLRGTRMARNSETGAWAAHDWCFPLLEVHVRGREICACGGRVVAVVRVHPTGTVTVDLPVQRIPNPGVEPDHPLS